MASRDSKSASSREHFQAQLAELKEIKIDLDNLKTELTKAQAKYDQHAIDYEAKLVQLNALVEKIRQEQDEREAHLLNTASEWFDIKTKLTSSAMSPKQKVILNVGGEYFETTVDTLTRDSQGSTTYFTALFSKQWELERDPEDNSIFIDRDGHLFSYILQYLRTGQVAIDANCGLLRRDLITEAQFYQLNSLINLLKTTEISAQGRKSERVQLFASSTLLTVEDQVKLNKLSGFIDQEWQLIYRGSRDGYTAQIFHKFCDGRFPSITVIRSNNGCIFGGFTTIAWGSSGQDKADASAFLFTLKNPHGIPPTKYKVREKSVRFAIAHNPAGGPTFGSVDNGGSDISLHSPFNASGNRTFFSRTYEDSTGRDRNTFTGDSHFICDDVEVFTSI